jgi:hypothetical protein
MGTNLHLNLQPTSSTIRNIRIESLTLWTRHQSADQLYALVRTLEVHVRSLRIRKSAQSGTSVHYYAFHVILQKYNVTTSRRNNSLIGDKIAFHTIEVPHEEIKSNSTQDCLQKLQCFHNFFVLEHNKSAFLVDTFEFTGIHGLICSKMNFSWNYMVSFNYYTSSF